MYNLPYFKEDDQALVLDFIRKNPFAFLSGCDEHNSPVATQIPVFLEQRGSKLYLTGHMMRQTDHHKAFEKNPHVLCVFTGPHTYVSARWYTNPSQASTWNYMSVHAKGKISFLDFEGLVEVLRKTSLYFENGDGGSPTIYDNLPSEYRNRLMQAIVAFEVEVTGMDHVFKLSQNRDLESYEHIIQKLRGQDENGTMIAEEMEKRKRDLYNL